MDISVVTVSLSLSTDGIFLYQGTIHVRKYIFFIVSDHKFVTQASLMTGHALWSCQEMSLQFSGTDSTSCRDQLPPTRIFSEHRLCPAFSLLSYLEETQQDNKIIQEFYFCKKQNVIRLWISWNERFVVVVWFGCCSFLSTDWGCEKDREDVK